MGQEYQLQKKHMGQLKSFLAECKIQNPNNKKILEIGFKNGFFLDQCRKRGLIPTGIEINKEYYETAKARYPDLDLIWYDGSAFPVAEKSFDFVVSFQVLEHVDSIDHIFNECIRVLKPMGMMYHICPNYHSFYEGHCKVIWLPFLNKPLGRLYLKLLRRYRQQYETFNLITPKIIATILKNYRDKITIISLGQAEFVKKFNDEQIKKINQRLLQRALKLLLRLPRIKKCLLEFIVRANLYYPITLIAMKKNEIITV